jgi:8-oxo-dGTP pyrophosphatase MutT (NUDIX family)
VPDLDFGDPLRTRMTQHLASFDRVASPRDDTLRAAAVALTIVGDDAGRACFLLTRRAATLKRHAAQWALPGGRMDADEGPAEAARRELSEEVGLELDGDCVLGILDDYPTRSGFVITPIVLWGSAEPQLEPDANEVESVHLVPLAILEEPEVPRLIPGPDPERPVIQVPLYGRYVHAPTAAILYQLREAGLHGRATRVAHFDQPFFAWK